MLVGVKPDRPSASYKLNTLVSNRIRETTSGKTARSRGSRALQPGTLCSLSREAAKVVGETCALELDKCDSKSWPHCFTSYVTLDKPPDLSESASPSGEWEQSGCVVTELQRVWMR